GTRFFAGRFATMIFGLPGAALAMYLCLPKANRKKDGGLYLSGGLTSFLTGITEPLEYSFLFVAPWLYLIHSFLDGCSFYFADIMNIRIGNSFSGGLIDYLLFGVLQGKDKTNWPNVLLLGVIWFFLYFFVFTFCIKEFHVNIPGMQVETDSGTDAIVASAPQTGDKLFNESSQIIAALGGMDNIKTISACATRLRIALKDNNKVNEAVFKQLGSQGVLKVAGGVQAIFGGKADLYSQEINDIIANPGSKPVIEDRDIARNEKTSESVITKNVNVAFQAPVNGKYKAITAVSDEVFSKKLMGEGFAIEPRDGEIYSPVAGTVVSIFNTKHAIGLKTAQGLEVLIHMGIDTVDLGGKPFTISVKEGDEVVAGTKLAKMDIAEIFAAGKQPTTITVITNSGNNLAKVEDKVQTGTEVK
ncbi:PTS sugar transporter subunit IIABC, partial [Lactobacillus sp. XV13L]|nr:PTS sugar transporter subunit IIABC [Lactobacillus sp. XV13L]